MSELPDGAVEAVAKLLYAKHCRWMGHRDTWGTEHPDYRAYWADEARPLVAAAAPKFRAHIAAGIRAYAATAYQGPTAAGLTAEFLADRIARDAL